MGALTKAQMAERPVDEVGFNQREASEIVEQFFDEIAGVLASNEPVKLSGFGNFSLRDPAGQRRAAGPESQNRRSVSHCRPAGGDVSCRSEIQGQNGSLRRAAIQGVR